MNLADSLEFHMLLWLFSLDLLRTSSLYNKTLSLKILQFYMAGGPSKRNSVVSLAYSH